MSDSHDLVFDTGTGTSPPAGAHSPAMAAIRAELERAFGAARAAGGTQTAAAAVSDAARRPATALAGGAGWAVADEQTAAQQHMAGGYDTA